MEVDLKPTQTMGLWPGIALLTVFAAAYYPVLVGLVSAWQSSDDYSHGFLILPICGYLLWQKRDSLRDIPLAPAWAGLILTAFSLGVYLFARLAEIYTLASLSLIPVIAGMIISLFGWRMCKECLFPLFLLLFMIPVPAQIYSALTIPLQLFVTKVVVQISPLLGIPIYNEGNVIHLPEQTLQVVQACSGLRSIMTLLTLGAVFGYMSLRSNLLRGGLLLAGIPIAIAVNIFRVLAMVVGFYFFNVDLTAGTAHTAFGVIIFAAALILFFLTRRVLALWDR